jgi:acyl-CoA thioester hydrolase
VAPDRLPPPFTWAVVPRYAEVDQQGVVFNGHYLTWFDEACTAYLDHIGVPYDVLIADGVDFQVVHTEIDFAAPVRWRDDVAVGVRCERVGTTSFTLGFTVSRNGTPAVTARTVYVVVSTADWTKTAVPDDVRAALSAGG